MVGTNSIFYKPVLFLTVFAIFCSSVAVQIARSQALTDDTWTQPFNLSHSGSSSSPQLIIDAAGTFHAIWIDAFNGYMYSESTDGNHWSTPTPVNFPFGINDSQPILIQDSKGYINAFWRDNKNALFYSKILSVNFGNGAWWKVVQLSDSALDVAVQEGSNGIVHLAYVKGTSALDSPAGIYYQQMNVKLSIWSDAQMLYQSQYFRSLNPGEAHIRMAASTADGSKNVYIVWDNIPLKRIFFVKSIDEGSSWIQPMEIKGPDANLGDVAPFNINIAEEQKNLLLIWQSGAPGSNCVQYSQVSIDGGDTWGAVGPVFKDVSECPKQNNFIPLNGNGSLLLLSNINDRDYLTAWNGSEWSNPQSTLSGFNDPDTANLIAYGCQQAVSNGTDKLYLIGCDQGSGGDIWITSRAIGSVDNWFSPNSIWTSPDIVTNVSSKMSSTRLIADNNNRFHLFWIQKDLSAPSTNQMAIYYAFSDGGQWSQPAAAINPTQGDVNYLDTAVRGGNLLLVWGEGSPSQIYFSQVSINQASNFRQWSSPFALPSIRNGVGSLNLLVDNSGVIYVVYSIPVDENRGIYLDKSIDGGVNWTGPTLIADAVLNGWDMVGSPQIAANGDGTLDSTWISYPSPGNNGSQTLYSSQSVDNGLTWSNPIDQAEGQISWSQLLGIKGNSVNLLWQSTDSSSLSLWHEFSQDGGASWALPAAIPNILSPVGTPAITVDSAGSLHLFQIEQETPENLNIGYWLWNNKQWISEGGLNIGNDSNLLPSLFAAVISPSGELMVIYPGISRDTTSGSSINALFYSSQLVTIPSVSQTLQAQSTGVPTSTLAPLITGEPNITPTPTSVPVINPIPGAGSESTNNIWSGLLPGIGLSVLIVAGIISLRLIKMKGR